MLTTTMPKSMKCALSLCVVILTATYIISATSSAVYNDMYGQIQCCGGTASDIMMFRKMLNKAGIIPVKCDMIIGNKDDYTLIITTNNGQFHLNANRGFSPGRIYYGLFNNYNEVLYEQYVPAAT